MDQHLTRRCLVAATLALSAVAGACDDAVNDPLLPDVSASVTGWERTAFDVYTQNLFLGGDTGPLFDPAVLGNPVALVQAVGQFWSDVQASDAQARMDRIAQEIGALNPEVVGVQEALQFVTLNGSFQPDGAGFIDFLGALQGAIASRGLPYDVSVVRSTTSSALPLEIDFTTGQVTRYLGFTDRVAILKRTDVTMTDADSATFTAKIPVAPGVEIKRGWARLTVDHEGETHHFVTTHLETQGVAGGALNEAQGLELLSVVGSLDGVTVVVGDMNSDAEASAGDPSYTQTYGNFVDAGFADLWEISPHSRTDPGFTCCQDKDLQNETSLLDERIDFVFARSTDGPIPGEGERRGHFRSITVLDQPGDRTASGLWPSDHAGLYGSLRPESADGDE